MEWEAKLKKHETLSWATEGEEATNLPPSPGIFKGMTVSDSENRPGKELVGSQGDLEPLGARLDCWAAGGGDFLPA